MKQNKDFIFKKKLYAYTTHGFYCLLRREWQLCTLKLRLLRFLECQPNEFDDVNAHKSLLSTLIVIIIIIIFHGFNLYFPFKKIPICIILGSFMKSQLLINLCIYNKNIKCVHRYVEIVHNHLIKM